MKIPNSSSISGSPFATPLNIRDSASGTSLPKIVAADVPIFARSLTCLVVKPANLPIEANCAASWKLIAYLVVLCSSLATDCILVPVALAKLL